ncbi:MAG: protease inhibitor I42 family protein [Gammaproteobacteria bacterium]|nr:protease inhibitor I42 family protein [Gammaproteobacteria bacterium]
MIKLIKKPLTLLLVISALSAAIPTITLAAMSTVINCSQVATINADKPTYQLSLPSNLTTGFRWYLLPYNSNLIQISHYNYLHPKPSTPPRVGVGGHEQWTIKLAPAAFAAPTLLKLRLAKARYWSIDHTQNFYTLCLVTVQSEGHCQV